MLREFTRFYSIAENIIQKFKDIINLFYEKHVCIINLKLLSWIMFILVDTMYITVPAG